MKYEWIIVRRHLYSMGRQMGFTSAIAIVGGGRPRDQTQSPTGNALDEKIDIGYSLAAFIMSGEQEGTDLE